MTGFDDDDQSAETHLDISEYDITTIPNDFNLLTIINFMEAGSIVVPAFQRNYVWDIKRASRLIESLILGLPVPQIFLYEEAKNDFLVIDGQQRLMTIYYFYKCRFPKKSKRAELRKIFDEHGELPDHILQDNTYFSDFVLDLETGFTNVKNKFDGLTYDTLGGYQQQLNLRTIRNVVIRQNEPKFDESSKYEIFNRLNTGGTNLKAQEIRSSLYHSEFYNSLYKLNALSSWRRLQKVKEPDLYMKDVEVLLRSIALMVDRQNYAAPMTRFLNEFSGKHVRNSKKENDLIVAIMKNFLKACDHLPDDIFLSKKTRSKNFNIALFEAVFCATCSSHYKSKALKTINLSASKIQKIASDPAFKSFLHEGTTKRTNLTERIKLAEKILGS